MSSEQGIARRALRDERAALRNRIAASPTDVSARTTLAESYRAEGYLDQAGRWGLLVPGGSTENERRLFARVVSRTGESTLARVRRLLLVPEDSPMDEFDPDGLLPGFAEILREETAAVRVTGPRRITPRADAGETALLFVVILVLGFAIEGVITFVSLLFGADLDTLWTVGLTVGGLTAAGLVAGAAYVVVQAVRRARTAARLPHRAS
jgi:hypothetical protein